MWDVSALTGSCPKMGVLLAKWELTWTTQARFVRVRNASLKVFKLLDQHCKYHVFFFGGGGGGGGIVAAITVLSLVCSLVKH